MMPDDTRFVAVVQSASLPRSWCVVAVVVRCIVLGCTRDRPYIEFAEAFKEARHPLILSHELLKPSFVV